MRQLKAINAVFFGEENHRPRFINNQRNPLNPYVNQLANSELYIKRLVLFTLSATPGFTYNNAQEVIKHRNRLRYNPSNEPEEHGEEHPTESREQGAATNVFRTTENANIDVFLTSRVKSYQ
jgi:hypothetical protein